MASSGLVDQRFLYHDRGMSCLRSGEVFIHRIATFPDEDSENAGVREVASCNHFDDRLWVGGFIQVI